MLTLSVPGVRHSHFYRGPRGWALAYPGAFDTRVFERQISLSGRTRPLSSGIRKNLSMFLRYVFSILDISSLLLSIQM